jgi:ATP-dependent exoDNAse (exonuclease V) alpha subunit
LGETVRVTRDVSHGWTTAQKQEMRNFRPGQVLGFHRQINGIAKHETVEVVRVDQTHLTVLNERGEKRIVTARHAKAFDVRERTEIEVAAGDRLLLTANRRDPGFHATNGEIVTVSSVDSRGGIELNDGRVLPANFRQFTHGYAVTAHRSQGKTVDSVIISADGMRKELFYVAASRGRQSVVVLTSDKEGLRQSVAQSAARKSPSELAGRMPRCCPRGERRGLAAAREIVRRVAQYVNSLPGRIRREVRERTHERGFGR